MLRTETMVDMFAMKTDKNKGWHVQRNSSTVFGLKQRQFVVIHMGRFRRKLLRRASASMQFVSPQQQRVSVHVCVCVCIRPEITSNATARPMCIRAGTAHRVEVSIRKSKLSSHHKLLQKTPSCQFNGVQQQRGPGNID